MNEKLNWFTKSRSRITRIQLAEDVERLVAERDEARAEVERLKEQVQLRHSAYLEGLEENERLRAALREIERDAMNGHAMSAVNKCREALAPEPTAWTATVGHLRERGEDAQALLDKAADNLASLAPEPKPEGHEVCPIHGNTLTKSSHGHTRFHCKSCKAEYDLAGCDE